ncbi:diguanylate cyclase domain-containing protein [Crocosphaera sp.]|uniref:diguanylate cyclase domain-containing protein n=1 Tax=Crocosphaera sp. TaxID=2729996 RepID=UPI003F2190CA|nr:diguanylate cyclase [Crocosphaera sp.]
MNQITTISEETLAGTILIVDDQLPNLKILANLLKNNNYKVKKALDGESALISINKEIPDLILLDIKMPDLDGYEVCNKLKFNPKTKEIPIIFISALNEVFDKVKAFEVGGIDYITKPFQEEEVLARVKSQLTIQNQKKLLEIERNKLILERKNLKQEIKQRKETEAILYQSRALISGILTSSLDAIAALEAVRNPRTAEIMDFRCLVINPIMARVFNQEPEDLIGKLVFKRFIYKNNPNLFPKFIEVVETGKSLEQDFNYYYQEERKWYHFIAVKLGDGFAITVRDITVRKHLELKLKNLATKDGLTGICNRRTFDETIRKEWKLFQREKTPLSLIICDLDYFGFYNNFYGHQMGDDCLKKVAQIMEDTIQRPGDLVARFGGEEFAIILPQTDQHGAITVAKRIQEAIRLQAIPHEQSKVSDIVSVSMGIATMIPIAESNPDILIKRADQALYSAKNQGRDRYFIL